MTQRSWKAGEKSREADSAPAAKPLLFFYDCEAANSSVFQGDIIEVAAKCDPDIIFASFDALVKSEQDLSWFAVEQCGIKKDDLADKSCFPKILSNLLKWMKNIIKKVNRRANCKYFPVICAHGGFGFDYMMLLSNMKKYNVDESVLKKANLHFADTFNYIKEIQNCDIPCAELCGIRLSMDSLFAKFCPGQVFESRHRAMGDVNAMIKIFCQEPLKTWMKQIPYVTSEALCQTFHKQFSQKEQQLLLEDKLSKLDAYTKCVNVKKLLQIQLTYDEIQHIFENCCSFMDFYEFMKEMGIDRKTAKQLASQFGAMGLRNQGAAPYCAFTKSKRDEEEIEGVLENGIDLRVDPALLTETMDYQRPSNVPELPPDEFVAPETSECWDTEADVNRSFVIRLEKPAIPLSVTIDEFISPEKSFKGRNGKNKKKANKHNKTVPPSNQTDDVPLQSNQNESFKMLRDQNGTIQPPNNQAEILQPLNNKAGILQVPNNQPGITQWPSNNQPGILRPSNNESGLFQLPSNQAGIIPPSTAQSGILQRPNNQSEIVEHCKNEGTVKCHSVSNEVPTTKCEQSKCNLENTVPCAVNIVTVQNYMSNASDVGDFNGIRSQAGEPVAYITDETDPNNRENTGCSGGISRDFPQRSKEENEMKNSVADVQGLYHTYGRLTSDNEDYNDYGSSLEDVQLGAQACVGLGSDLGAVFTYVEQDEVQRTWPRELIWVGDVPIYVPVEPTVSESNATDIRQEGYVTVESGGVITAAVCSVGRDEADDIASQLTEVVISSSTNTAQGMASNATEYNGVPCSNNTNGYQDCVQRRFINGEQMIPATYGSHCESHPSYNYPTGYMRQQQNIPTPRYYNYPRQTNAKLPQSIPI